MYLYAWNSICRIIKTCFFRSFCVFVLKCALNLYLTKFLISVVAAWETSPRWEEDKGARKSRRLLGISSDRQGNIMARNYSRTPPPRSLGGHETLESLSHWQTTFRTFYKKDDSYKIFFKIDQKWNYLLPNYNLKDEVDGDKRTAAELAEDLADLLTMSRLLAKLY